MPEIRQKLYISPQTDAGKIWNALVLKMTTWKKKHAAESVQDRAEKQVGANVVILPLH
jgi:hypothetical protein